MEDARSALEQAIHERNAEKFEKALTIAGIGDCSCCGEEHPKLFWTRYVRNEWGDGPAWWATCPTTGDPITMVQIPACADCLAKEAR